MKSINEIVEHHRLIETYVNENKTGETIDSIVKSQDSTPKKIGYVSEYGRSIEFTNKLVEHGMYHEPNEGATLYPDGRLIFFLSFKDVVQLCRFMVEFKYEDKFTGEDEIHDGKWHFYFDLHGDPLTGVDNKCARFHLIYCAKSKYIDEIDNALDDLIKQIDKSQIGLN